MLDLCEQGLKVGGDHKREALGAHGGVFAELFVHGFQKQHQSPPEVSMDTAVNQLAGYVTPSALTVSGSGMPVTFRPWAF